MSHSTRKTAWELSQPDKPVAAFVELPTITLHPDEIRVSLTRKLVCIRPSDESVQQYAKPLLPRRRQAA